MKYNLLKYSLLSLLVMLCGNVFADYEKVTSTAGLTSGEYLIVCEEAGVALNGGLTDKLDAISNTVEAAIADGKIASTTELDAATITYDATTKTLKGAGGLFMGQTSDANGLQSSAETTYENAISFDDEGNADIVSGGAYLRYNASSDQTRFRYYKSSTYTRQKAVQLYKKTGQVYFATKTKVVLGKHESSGYVGDELALPTAKVYQLSGAIEDEGQLMEDAVVTWSSSAPDVAEISGQAIKLKAAGTTVIKATYAGATINGMAFAGSSATYTLTVSAAPYTSFKALQEAVTTTSAPATIQFNGQQVVFVNGNNAYLADADGYGIMIYTKNHGLEAGQVLNGTIDAAIQLYQGSAEITNFTTEGLTITTADVVPVETAVGRINTANQSTLVTLKNLTASVSEDGKTITLADGESTITFYDKFKTGIEIEDGKAYDITGIVILFNEVLEICPRTADDVTVAKPIEPAEFQDFEITNADMSGEFDTSKLPAGVTFTGTQRNDNHGYGNVTLTVAVDRAVRFTIGGCQYANPATCKVTNAEGELLAEPNLKTATCYHQDGAAVTYEYTGEPTTLTFSGIAYLPYFKAEAIEIPQDITGTWDYANASVMEATVALSGSSEAGEVEAVEKNGLTMTVEANGASFRNNGDNIQVRSGAVFKVPVRNAGDLITVKGYPGYSYYTIGNSTDVLNDENTYKAKISDAEAGYVAITSQNDNNYYKSISVIQYAPKEKITLDNEAVTVTFALNEGTEGQKAEFSDGNYFLNSKVTYGSNLTLKDKYTLKDADTEENVDQTRFEPASKLNTADEQSAVRFMFTPKPGFAFTPTKVSFWVTRYGTDNGLVDVAWEGADGTANVLATEVKPARNNGKPNITKVSYDIEGAASVEGTQTLLLHLYSLQENKQFGLNNIVIEGILNGTEKDVPILASFKVNGKEYTVEDVFGEAYEATLELPKAEAMVSESNPLTDVTATSGDLGTVTYEGAEDNCTVTIPMTAGETTMAYVLNVVFKPDFTLTYLDVEGNVLGTQTVEKDATIGQFAYDIADVSATKDGYKARGWFKTAVLGEKFTTADVITANTNLYAIQTETEEASTHKKYNFDLTNQFFYAEDHEAFNPSGEGYYWHDAQHGWAFKNGNTVDLLVGPKAIITVTLCRYGSGTGIAVKKDGETLATLDGIADGDGGTAVYSYEGTEGTLTLEMQCGGEMYIHGVKIVNTAEVNFDNEGNWYFVKAGDAGSLIDVLDIVNGKNSSKEAERTFVFLPDGTYDLDATVKTAITGHNISIIGQSMDKTIIVTKPDKSIEGLGKADLFDNSGTNLYMQDLTLQNALDYYQAGSAGRAAVLQDAGTRTIGKNVRMLSYQDTYYSSNSNQQAYWETCDIHGTVDFICGGGDIRFQNTTISLEPRALNGSGSRTITAPTTTTQFGYVFDGCKVVDLAEGKGNWNYGRTWQNEPITVFLNTTLDDNAAKTIINTRWIEKGMNNKDPKLFGEYGTKDANGNNITPESNKINSFGGTFETILTAEQTAAFAYDKMFTDWNPALLARQVDAPTATYANGKVTWTPANNGAIAYALFKNGVFAGITEDSSFEIEAGADDVLTIRAANAQGGFGEATQVTSSTTGIEEIDNTKQNAENVVFDLQGRRLNSQFSNIKHQVIIVNGKKVVR